MPEKSLRMSTLVEKMASYKSSVLPEEITVLEYIVERKRGSLFQ